MTTRTDKPFPDAISELLRDRNMSIRELHRTTRRKTGWGAMSTVHFMVRGDMPPSQQALEAMSKALNIRPDYFAEYRLAKMRERLDPNAVGFKKALRALDGCGGSG